MPSLMPSQTRRGDSTKVESLAGNDASEFSSTMSSGSDRFKPQRFEHRKSAAAAAMNANPTTYVRRRVTAMRISFDISCLSEKGYLELDIVWVSESS